MSPSETLYEREKKLEAQMVREDKLFKVVIIGGGILILGLIIWLICLI